MKDETSHEKNAGRKIPDTGEFHVTLKSN